MTHSLTNELARTSPAVNDKSEFAVTRVSRLRALDSKMDERVPRRRTRRRRRHGQARDSMAARARLVHTRGCGTARALPRAMPDVDGGSEKGTLLAVALKQEPSQVAEIVRVLSDLEIVVERLPAGPEDDGRVVIRIPPERVLEAVLALNYHGFAEVRVYR